MIDIYILFYLILLYMSSRINEDQGSFCAPGVNNKHGTCFDRVGLMRIITDFNRKYPDHKINYVKNTSNQKLWELIRNGMASRCGDSEWCWLDQSFLKKDSVIQNYYRPPRPTNPRKWLSTSDIDDVLKQYERLYNDFFFMGTVPLDFDTVIEAYKQMNLCSNRNRRGHPVTKYGFVFNLDPHDKNGSHWVSMFLRLDMINPVIGFFDSYGHPPPAQIKRLIERLRKQALDCFGIHLNYKCNTVQHQHKNTECGVYSLYFIFQCLRGISFEEITEHIILDDDVNQFRKFFFRPTIYYHDDKGKTPRVGHYEQVGTYTE